MCNKMSYPTKTEALKDAKIILNKHRRFSRAMKRVSASAKKLKPYKCPICGNYHLTSSRRKRKEFRSKER